MSDKETLIRAVNAILDFVEEVNCCDVMCLSKAEELVWIFDTDLNFAGIIQDLIDMGDLVECVYVLPNTIWRRKVLFPAGTKIEANCEVSLKT